MIFGVVSVVGMIIGVFFPVLHLLLSISYALFVMGTLGYGLQYPKWRVKMYTGFVVVWEAFFIMLYARGFHFYFIHFLVSLAGVTLPLIPLWFLMYREFLYIHLNMMRISRYLPND